MLSSFPFTKKKTLSGLKIPIFSSLGHLLFDYPLCILILKLTRGQKECGGVGIYEINENINEAGRNHAALFEL